MAVVERRAFCLLLMLLDLVSPVWASGPPKMRGKPHRRHLAKRGKNTMLRCPVEPDHMQFTKWTKDGKDINSAWTRFKVNEDGHLQIRDVQMKDAGLYVCRATNNFGSTSISYTVMVLAKPVFKNLKKMQKDQTYVRAAGRTVRLKCRAKGNPQPQVSWLKDDMPVSAEWDARRRPHMILKLTKLRESDTGFYTCLVSNRLGRLSFTYKLQVIDQVRTKPKLISSHPHNTTVEPGETASFQCRVKSWVQPHIKWLKRVEDGDIDLVVNRTIDVKGQKFEVLHTADELVSKAPDGSFLNKLLIHRATAKDSGMYICAAINSNGYSVRSAYLNVVLAGHLDGTGVNRSSSSNNLPLYVGGGVALLLIILAILLLKKCIAIQTRQTALKRLRLPVPNHYRLSVPNHHRLPVPNRHRQTGSHAYHSSPTTTTTTTTTTARGTGTVTSLSDTITVHGNLLHPNTLYNSSLLLSLEKLPKVPAPSSNVSSVSSSQSHPHH